ncbi:9370_t:CDS:2, partial [Racocetra persica]
AVEKDIGDLAEALKPENTPKVRSFLREISKDLPILTSEELLAFSERNVSKIVAEVKKLLPSGTSINVIKRRIATARKIYDIFSTIDEIEFIKTGNNKPKFRTERK